MRNKYNIIYIKNNINWIKMIEMILNDENGKLFLINRFKELIKRINENKTFFLNIINSNINIKNQYLKILRNNEKHFTFNKLFYKI